MHLLLKLRASLIIKKVSDNLKSLPDERSDGQKRIDRVKEKVNEGVPYWELIIEKTRTSVADYKELINSDVETIAKNYRSKIIG